MPSVFNALALLPEVARSALYKLMPGRDPFVRESFGGPMPTNEEITGAAGGLPATGVGSIGWKLTKNAPSWLQRAFESGKREVPLQGSTPRRLPLESPGLVKNPVTYELPESNVGLRQLLEQEGGAYTGLGGEEGMTRLYRGEVSNPLPMPKWAEGEDWPGHYGEWFTTNKTKAKRFQDSSGGRLKFVDVPQGELEQYNVDKVFRNAFAPNEYVVPREIQDKLWTRFLKEQPESFGKRKLPPISGGSPSMFEKFTSKGLPIPESLRNPERKSTQDILGGAIKRGYAEYTQNTYLDKPLPFEDWAPDSSLGQALEDSFTINNLTKPDRPRESLLRATRFMTGTEPTELEQAAALKRALTVNPQMLQRLLTKERAQQMFQWMRDFLGE